MTVKDLIAELQKVDANLLVVAQSFEEDFCHELVQVELFNERCDPIEEQNEITSRYLLLTLSEHPPKDLDDL